MDKIAQLRFTMQRMDHYYNGVNLKGTFLLGINTFLIGACLTSLKTQIAIPGDTSFWLIANFVMITLFSLLSIAFVLRAILPFLTTGNSYDYASLIAFGSIAVTSFKDFHSSVKEMDEDNVQEDMARQIHTLSQGLKRKFIRIRNAGIALLLAIVAAIPFFYQLLNNAS